MLLLSARPPYNAQHGSRVCASALRSCTGLHQANKGSQQLTRFEEASLPEGGWERGYGTCRGKLEPSWGLGPDEVRVCIQYSLRLNYIVELRTLYLHLKVCRREDVDHKIMHTSSS